MYISCFIFFCHMSNFLSFFITRFLSLYCCSNKYPHYIVVYNPGNKTTPSLNYITSHVQELLRVRGRNTRVLCQGCHKGKTDFEKRYYFSSSVGVSEHEAAGL